MKKNNLQQYFPMIRTRKELLREIGANPSLKTQFNTLKPERQQEFLNFCSGVKGVRLLYDSFFKAVMDPDRDPSRLSDFLSLLLQRKVTVVSVLSNEGQIMPDTLVVMDLIVRLEDGSITTVEVQRYGYAFPGQRAACYSADMLLRQYKQKRDQASANGTRMNYRSLRPVYTIVLYEFSPAEFHAYPGDYVHRFHQVSNTGLEMDLLEEYIFVPLDILKEIVQNNGIRNQLEAWLAFFCMDEPEWVLKLSENYPMFRKMYEEVYEMCRNLEGVMQMYSKELRELDSNTVQYMIDQMQEDLNRKDAELSQKDVQLNQQHVQLSQKDTQLSQKDKMIRDQAAKLNQKNTQLSQQENLIAELQNQIQEMKKLLAENPKL